MEDLCCNCSKKTWTTNKNINEFDLSNNNIIKKEENDIVDKNNNIENKEQNKDVIKDNIKENKENSIKENNEKNDKQDAIEQCLEKLTNLMAMMVEQKKNEENHENSIKENNEENNENNIEDNVKNDNKDIKLQQQPDNIKKLQTNLLIMQYRYYELYQQFIELEEEEEEERYESYPKERRKNKKNIIKNNLKTNTIISTTNNNMLDEKNTGNIIFNDLLKEDADDKLEEIKAKIYDFYNRSDDRKKLKFTSLKKADNTKILDNDNINNTININNNDNDNNENNNKINETQSIDDSSAYVENKKQTLREEIEEYSLQIQLLNTYISAKQKKQRNREQQKNKDSIDFCLEQIESILETIHTQELAYRGNKGKDGKQSDFLKLISQNINNFLEDIYGKDSDIADNIIGGLTKRDGFEQINNAISNSRRYVVQEHFFSSFRTFINELYKIACEKDKKDDNKWANYKRELCLICEEVQSKLKEKKIWTWTQREKEEETGSQLLIPKKARLNMFLYNEKEMNYNASEYMILSGNKKNKINLLSND